MIINGINFPREILEAISSESLVIFAGAGVSVDKPTALPDFIGLTKSIANQCGEIFDEKNDKIDEFLGDLQRNDIKVKELVAKRLTQGKPQPNAFHFNILNLFNKIDSIRIVTTNQDCMFEAAVKKQGWKIPVFDSPAVPYGDDFNGIVHLHGNVSNPRNIVVTDEDFGKAYMLNGYATRFVIDMLKQYTVLFVGYSYNDVIVRYLTTSIPSDTFSGAYILCDSNAKKINRTGIKSIIFPKGKYNIACSAIKKIGDFSKRGLIDWKDRIGSLNIDAPPADKESQDEVLEGIHNFAVQKFLCDRIRGSAWLMWLDQQDVFSSLFKENVQLDKNDELWGYWLISNFISDELINLIIKHNNKINFIFCENILRAFIPDKSRLQNGVFEMYIILFQKKIQNEFVLYKLIQSAEKRGMLDCMWNLFSDTFNFDIVLKNRYSWTSKSTEYSMAYRWRVGEYNFENIWYKFVSLHLDKYAYNAIQLATNTIKDLYYKLHASDVKGNIFKIDMLDIENNDRHHYQNKELYIMFNMIVQAFNIIYQNDEPYSILWINQTLELKLPLLTRIVLFLLRENTHLLADDKIEYVIENCDFHEIRIREQVFKLVANVFDDIGEKKRETVLQKIMSVDSSGMDFENEKEKNRHISYIKYNWLNWLNDKCNKTDKIIFELKRIKDQFPYFKPRKRPDLVIGPIEVMHGSESPISTEELRKMRGKKGYNYIINFKEDASSMGPDRYGLLQTLSEVAGEDKKWTMEFIDELECNANWEETIWEHILIGLRKSVRKKNDLIAVLNHMNKDAIKENTFFVAQFLLDSLEKDEIYHNISDRLRTRLIQMIKFMWNFRQSKRTSSEDWTFGAHNGTTGILANVVMRIICLEPVENGISSWFVSFVKKIIPGSGDIEEFICVISIYAAQLFARDEKWTKENVLIYLSSDDSDYVQAAWEGLIFGLHDFNIPFATTMLPIFHNNIEVRRNLNEDFRKRFIYDYVVLLAYVDDNPLENHIGKIIKGSTESDKHHFAFSIYMILKNMTKVQRSELWNRWLKEYWELRINNTPEKLCSEELNQMLKWVLLLQDEYEDVVDLVLRSDCNGLNSYNVIEDLKNSEVVEEKPQKTGELLVYLLQHEGAWLDKQEVSVLIEKLRRKGVGDNTMRMLDELVQEI